MKLACFVLLFALLGLAAAQPAKIYIGPKTSFDLEEGFQQTVTFRLSGPIVCANAFDDCSVTILIHNSHPGDISVDTCQVTWTKTTWNNEITVTITSVDDFIDDSIIKRVLVTDPAISNSAYYKDVNVADIEITSKPRPSATCSGVGDPHYNTFDNKVWHQYAPGTVVFYKRVNDPAAPYSAIDDFEIQTKMRRPPYAINCGLVGREGQDVVKFDACSGSINVDVRILSPEGKGPRVEINNGQYWAYWPSGRWMRADGRSWYVNIYAGAPGRDSGKTAGMCGNFNGNKDDDAPYNVVWSLSDLFESQQVKPNRNLWDFPWNDWVFPAPANVILPPGHEKCPYTAPIARRPVLNHVNLEDITDLLKEAAAVNDNDLGKQFTFEANPDETTPTKEPPALADIIAVCERRIANSPLGVACAAELNVDMEPFVTDCTNDLQVMGGEETFVQDSYNAMQNACADLVERNPDNWVENADGHVEPAVNGQIAEFVNLLCADDCNGRGTCSQGKCTCNGAFIGDACEHDPLSPAVITALLPGSCNTQAGSCPASIAVPGNNFFKSDNLKCQFGDDEPVAAQFMGAHQLRCPLPATPAVAYEAVKKTVKVTNDGVLFSAPLTFAFHNSQCVSCANNGSGVCTAVPEVCQVNNKCYKKYVADPAFDNVCIECRPDLSTTSFGYSYRSGSNCGPKFDKQVYAHTLNKQYQADEELFVVDARNQLLTGDSSLALTYTLEPANGNDFFKIVPGSVKNTAKVLTSRAIDITDQATRAALNTQPAFKAVAKDQANNQVSVDLLFDLAYVGQTTAFFDKDTYDFTVDESILINAVVGQPIASYNTTLWGNVEFSFFFGSDSTFAIDKDTGAITLLKALDFESGKTEYQMTIEASDKDGTPHTAGVRVHVQNVNEAPTDIAVTPATVAENQAIGSLVGALTSEDPEGGAHTYTMQAASSQFELQGANVVTKQMFDFETGSKQFSFVAVSTDDAGNTFEKTITIDVTDVNEAPHSLSFTSLLYVDGDKTTVPENAVKDTVVGTIHYTEDDEGQNVECVTDTFNLFSIEGTQVKLIGKLDFETAPLHTFNVVCADSVANSLLSEPLSVTVHVSDAQEAPELVGLKGAGGAGEPTPVSEADSDVVVGTIVAEDADKDAADIRFEIAPAFTDRFVILEDTYTCVALGEGKRCSVQVATVGKLDFEGADVVATGNSGIISVPVILTDGSSGAQNDDANRNVQVAVTNTNDEPTGQAFSLHMAALTEEVAAGTVIGTVSVLDEDIGTDTYQWTLNAEDMFPPGIVAVKANARRDGGSATMDLVITDPTLLQYATTGAQRAVTFKVTVVDGVFTNVFDHSVAISEPAVELSQLAATVNENENVVIGALSVAGLVRPNVVASFVLVAGADADKFVLTAGAQANTAKLFFQSSSIPDYESLATGERVMTVDVQVSFDTSASVNTAAIAAITRTVTVTVVDVDEKPIFAPGPSTNIRIYWEETAMTFDLDAVDPESKPITYTLLSGSDAGWQVHPNTGVVSLSESPKVANSFIQKGLILKVRATSASDQSDYADWTATFEVYNGCPADVAGQTHECTTFSNCISDSETEYHCAPGTTFTAGSSAGSTGGDSGSSGIGGAAIGGIVVAVIVLVVLAVVLVVLLRKKQELGPTVKFEDKHFNNSTYDKVNSMSTNLQVMEDFTPGMCNPVYDWYQPDLSRKEVDDFLSDKAEGAFIVRDSKATPGWHMLAVKSRNEVIHEKIKLADGGIYELVPSRTSRAQPKFTQVPDLIEFYVHQGATKAGVGYSLAMDNPTYDNRRLQGLEVEDYGCAAKPMVPSKRAAANPAYDMSQSQSSGGEYLGIEGTYEVSGTHA